MNDLCTKYNTCVLCDNDNLELAFTLKDSPLAENYTNQPMEQPKYPLELYLCLDCKHLQLLHAINQRYLFENYSYQSKSSPGLVEHFRQYAIEMINTLGLTNGDLIVDIGSNDGTLLRQFKNRGINTIIGVEPSEKICNQAIDDGVPTYNDFFTHSIARIINERYGQANLITANNVFAHSRHLDRMIDAVYYLLHNDGTFVIEVSYLPLMMRNMVFDFIYHEHLCYHRFKPLQRFFQRHNMRIIRVEMNEMKGGTARFIVVKSRSERSSDITVHEAVMLEDEMKLDEVTPYRNFFCKITGAKQRVNNLLSYLHHRGRNIAGYGASATTTTLLHHFEIGQYLSCLVDDNQSRIELWSPGYNIPVVSTEYLYTEQPDYTLITAWRFAKQIMKAHPSYRGKWIIPLPELVEIENSELCDGELIKKST